MELAAQMGVDPVAMLLSLSDWAFKEWQLDQTADKANLVKDYATAAAPYVAPKLAAIEAKVGGFNGEPIAPSISVTIEPTAPPEAG